MTSRPDNGRGSCNDRGTCGIHWSAWGASVRKTPYKRPVERLTPQSAFDHLVEMTCPGNDGDMRNRRLLIQLRTFSAEQWSVPVTNGFASVRARRTGSRGPAMGNDPSIRRVKRISHGRTARFVLTSLNAQTHCAHTEQSFQP